MGNAIGGKDRKVAKVMKITGETLKFKAPLEAGEVLKDYPGLVLMESESVKHHGTRAKRLGAREMLLPRRLYFLVELPKEKAVPRRVKSGINMSAKDRLESLMLARRSVSDLSIMAKHPEDGDDGPGVTEKGKEAIKESKIRVKVKLPKEEVERVMKESKDEAEAAEKLLNLYIKASKDDRTNAGNCKSNVDEEHDAGNANVDGNVMDQPQQHLHWKASNGRKQEGPKKHGKRVSFLAPKGTMQIEVAS